MKTAIESVVFTKANVIQYCEAIGEENRLYYCEKYAQSLGLRTIPLPPAMPLIMYQSFHIPWQTEGTMVHRKQTCHMHRRMFIGGKYSGYITLSDVVTRRNYTFSKQTLFITDHEGALCFEGEFHLVTGELP